MAEILHFVRSGTSFDPETISLLAAAYDKATAELHERGQPKPAREVVAKRIIALAINGERDPDRLYKSALLALGVPE